MPPLPSIARSGLDTPAPAAERAGPALIALALASLTALLGACGSAPRIGRDGPPPGPPPEAARLADAEPRIEPLRVGGPNKPYEVLGRSYVPQTRDLPMRETGIASWYGQKFDGRRTASGEIFDMNAMTAAHKTMPLPSYARVRNPANGREVVVRVNDRGPFVDGRIIDLSYAAAVKLGVAGGIAPVEVERLTFEDIRTGAWRRGGGPAAPSPAVEPAPTAVAATRPPAAPAVTAATVAATRLPATTPAPSSTSAATIAPPPVGTPAGPPPPAVAAAPAAALLPANPAPASPPPVAAPTAREAGAEPLPGSGLALAIALMGDGAGGAAGGRSLGGPEADPRPASAPRSGPTSAVAALAASRTAGVPPAPVAAPSVTGAAASPRGFWIQLGAFREREGVESFQQRIAGDLDWLASRLTVFDEAPLFRLQAGPYASRDEAQVAAQQVREALQLVPLVIERR